MTIGVVQVMTRSQEHTDVDENDCDDHITVRAMLRRSSIPRLVGQHVGHDVNPRKADS